MRAAQPASPSSSSAASTQFDLFLRLPRDGERLFGLSRATLNALILGDNPRVKSFVVSARGRARGIRLIVKDSLLEFLRQTAASQGVEV